MKIRYFWLLVFCLLAVLDGIPAGQAQSIAHREPAVARQVENYTQIDRHALDAPKPAERSIAGLAAYLIQPARGDREKARAIFRWITAHIAYDDVAALTGRRRPSDPNSVLQGRTAVCTGYAGLFASLARAAGLEAVVLSGYGRGAGYVAGAAYPHARFTRRSGASTGVLANHAWNAVKIDGRWQLLDCTWGAGGAFAGTGIFTRRFEPFFFLTPPDQFLYTHLPSDPKWQLLDPPVSTAHHERLPYLRAAFFTNGLTLDSHRETIISCGSRVAITFGAPEGTDLITELTQAGRTVGPHIESERGGNGRCALFVDLPRPGDYILHIFAGNAQSGGLYDWAMDYRIEARPAEINSAKAPKNLRDGS
ncbi:MAG TPA: transglutaminase domain-containing protein [Chthonomonadaceae bacterium]|nr:transglutaminase domain-containing protein [Chthonomonadaceae bacterium]